MRKFLLTLLLAAFTIPASAQPVTGTWHAVLEGGGQAWIKFQQMEGRVTTSVIYMDEKRECQGAPPHPRRWDGQELKWQNGSPSWEVIREGRDRITIILPNPRTGVPDAVTYRRAPKANPVALCRGEGRKI
jgi:hypothetical protein